MARTYRETLDLADRVSEFYWHYSREVDALEAAIESRKLDAKALPYPSGGKTSEPRYSSPSPGPFGASTKRKVTLSALPTGDSPAVDRPSWGECREHAMLELRRAATECAEHVDDLVRQRSELESVERALDQTLPHTAYEKQARHSAPYPAPKLLSHYYTTQGTQGGKIRGDAHFAPAGQLIANLIATDTNITSYPALAIRLSDRLNAFLKDAGSQDAIANHLRQWYGPNKKAVKLDHKQAQKLRDQYDAKKFGPPFKPYT